MNSGSEKTPNARGRAFRGRRGRNTRGRGARGIPNSRRRNNDPAYRAPRIAPRPVTVQQIYFRQMGKFHLYSYCNGCTKI